MSVSKVIVTPNTGSADSAATTAELTQSSKKPNGKEEPSESPTEPDKRKTLEAGSEAGEL